MLPVVFLWSKVRFHSLLLQEIEVTEGARADARKKRKNWKKSGRVVPYLPVGPLPVMPNAVEDALRGLEMWFDPEISIGVRLNSNRS